MSWLRRALAVGAEGRQKAIAAEAFPAMSDAAALAELGKYLNGERGDSALRVVEAICKLGQRDSLCAAFDEHLHAVDPAHLVDDVRELHDQLELFGARVLKLGERLEEVAEVIPLKRRS